jgi:hypothetical protein
MDKVFTKEEIMKLVFSISGIIIIICLSIFLIYMFFQDDKLIYLLAGIILPIFMMFVSSQYFAGPSFVLIIITSGIFGFYYLGEPYKLVALSISIYMAMYKLVRYGNDLKGNYIYKDIIKNNDLCYLNELFNSDWFKENKDKNPYNIQLNSLINQKFHKEYIGNIINILVKNNIDEFSKSRYSKDILLKMHAIGIIHSLPVPISKNADGLVSIGSQLLLNTFSYLKTINNMKTIDFENDVLIISSIKQIITNSSSQFGDVSDEELDAIVNNKLISSRFNLLN